MRRRSESMFDRYYDAFLRNALGRRQRWRVRLADGETLEGVAWAGSFVDFANPVFMFQEGTRTYTIPFRLLEEAKVLG